MDEGVSIEEKKVCDGGGTSESTIADDRNLSRAERKRERRARKLAQKREQQKEIVRRQRKRQVQREKDKLKAEKKLLKEKAKLERWRQEQVKTESLLADASDPVKLLDMLKYENVKRMHPAFIGFQQERKNLETHKINPAYAGYKLLPKVNKENRLQASLTKQAFVIDTSAMLEDPMRDVLRILRDSRDPSSVKMKMRFLNSVRHILSLESEPMKGLAKNLRNHRDDGTMIEKGDAIPLVHPSFLGEKQPKRAQGLVLNDVTEVHPSFFGYISENTKSELQIRLQGMEAQNSAMQLSPRSLQRGPPDMDPGFELQTHPSCAGYKLEKQHLKTLKTFSVKTYSTFGKSKAFRDTVVFPHDHEFSPVFFGYSAVRRIKPSDPIEAWKEKIKAQDAVIVSPSISMRSDLKKLWSQYTVINRKMKVIQFTLLQGGTGAKEAGGRGAGRRGNVAGPTQIVDDNGKKESLVENFVEREERRLELREYQRRRETLHREMKEIWRKILKRELPMMLVLRYVRSHKLSHRVRVKAAYETKSKLAARRVQRWFRGCHVRSHFNWAKQGWDGRWRRRDKWSKRQHAQRLIRMRFNRERATQAKAARRTMKRETRMSVMCPNLHFQQHRLLSTADFSRRQTRGKGGESRPRLLSSASSQISSISEGTEEDGDGQGAGDSAKADQDGDASGDFDRNLWLSSDDDDSTDGESEGSVIEDEEDLDPMHTNNADQFWINPNVDLTQLVERQKEEEIERLNRFHSKMHPSWLAVRVKIGDEDAATVNPIFFGYQHLKQVESECGTDDEEDPPPQWVPPMSDTAVRCPICRAPPRAKHGIAGCPACWRNDQTCRTGYFNLPWVKKSKPAIVAGEMSRKTTANESQSETNPPPAPIATAGTPAAMSPLLNISRRSAGSKPKIRLQLSEISEDVEGNVADEQDGDRVSKADKGCTREKDKKRRKGESKIKKSKTKKGTRQIGDEYSIDAQKTRRRATMFAAAEALDRQRAAKALLHTPFADAHEVEQYRHEYKRYTTLLVKTLPSGGIAKITVEESDTVTYINFLALMNCADTGALAMGVLLLPTTRGAFYLSRELVPATATALGRMPGKLSLRDYHVFGKQLPNPSSVVLIKVHSVNHEYTPRLLMKFLTQNFHLSNNLSTRMIEFLDDLPDSLPGDDEVQSSIAQMVDEALAEKIRVKRQEILERKAEQRLKLIQATRLIKTTKLFEKKAAAEKRLRQREARMDLRKIRSMKAKLLEKGEILAEDWEKEQVRLAAEKRQRKREKKERAKLPKLKVAREGKPIGSRSTNLPSLGRKPMPEAKHKEEKGAVETNDVVIDAGGQDGGDRGIWEMFSSLFAWSNPEDEYMLDDEEMDESAIVEGEHMAEVEDSMEAVQ